MEITALTAICAKILLWKMPNIWLSIALISYFKDFREYVFLDLSESERLHGINVLKPHSHIQDSRPRPTRTQESWSIVVSLQKILCKRMAVWIVGTSRIEVSVGHDCFENFKTVVADRRRLHIQVGANR